MGTMVKRKVAARFDSFGKWTSRFVCDAWKIISALCVLSAGNIRVCRGRDVMRLEKENTYKQ